MTIDTGSCAFIIICSAMVFLMTPGLSFFYSGLERRKNALSTIMNCFFICGVASFLWVIVGYSLSFGTDHAGIIGGLDHLFFNNLDGVNGVIPEKLFAGFQMMFAIITMAILTGSLAGRMRFSALFIFIVIWSFVVYYPLAHMVWGEGGFIDGFGAVDFAGGNVVHISSGVSGLVAALFLGKRREFGSFLTSRTTFRLLYWALDCFGSAGSVSTPAVRWPQMVWRFTH